MESGHEHDTVARNIGRYTLFREVAHGGMATVHLGRLRGAGGFARTVAIKRLHPPFARNPEFVSMFLDEARLAARIQHPNVVPVLDVVAAEKELFLVMDYVHGESLATLLKRARASRIGVPARIVYGIIIDLLYGLHAAHEARSERGDPLEIVHRDVSPQNVLVGVDGVARVLDFGIAKAAERIHASTRSGQLKGKLAYMAPEQVATQQVDRRTDVYAAAVVLWEALTGERLFPQLETGALIAQILTREHAPPSRYHKDLPAAIDAAVMRGLARDPAHRFATARDMAAELEHVGSPATPREIGEWVKEIADHALRARAASISEIEVATLADGAAARASKPSIPPASHDGQDSPTEELDLQFEDMDPEGSALEWTPPRRIPPVAGWLAMGAAGLLAAGVILAYAHWSAAPQRASAQGSVDSTPHGSPPAATTIPSTVTAANGGWVPVPLGSPPPDPSPPEPTGVAPAPTSPPPSSGPRKAVALPRTPMPATTSSTSGAERGRASQGDCQPPYTVDARGVRIPKRWCS
jgi:serine/threonine-protein kinase